MGNGTGSNQEATDRMRTDEDIVGEENDLRQLSAGKTSSARAQKRATAIVQQHRHVPLNWQSGQGGHRPSADTRRLLNEAGGLAGIQRFTDIFYQRAFADEHIDKFIRDHDDPHGERFATWIVEKFGDGQPWTQERANRKVCPFQSHGHTLQTPHDRSSAHFAAWHSPKREAHKFGEHFKLDDCRVWMRLHFWAMREAGIFEASPAFAEYYISFIGHFVSVYERSATVFARESARWSADPRNIAAYLDNGNKMGEIIGVTLREALRSLPREEQEGQWPYEY